MKLCQDQPEGLPKVNGKRTNGSLRDGRSHDLANLLVLNLVLLLIDLPRSEKVVDLLVVL